MSVRAGVRSSDEPTQVGEHLGKNWKRMFVGSPKSIFKILEAIKKI